MIAFEGGEARGLSEAACSKPGVVVLSWLEEATGADALVSPLSIPLTKATLPIHLSERACLVQIKHGEDLLSSAGYRANDSLARMISVTAAPWQRILLPVGFYAVGSDGACLIGDRKPASDPNKPFLTWWKSRGSWATYKSILRRWCLRGGVVGSGCTDSDFLWDWLHDLENDLKILDPVKEFWQQPETLEELKPGSNPLQELQPVRDWRVLLAAFPGIGPSKIDALVETFAAKGLTLTGIQALEWVLESPLTATIHVPGWGVKTHRRLRAWVGLNDDQALWIGKFPADFPGAMQAAIEEAKKLDGYTEPPEDD